MQSSYPSETQSSSFVFRDRRGEAARRYLRGPCSAHLNAVLEVKKPMKKIYKILSGIITIAVLVAAFRAYFLRSVDLRNQIVYDGLGRVLSEPPLWARFFVTEEKAWAGIGWHLIDITWFFGGLCIAFWLYSLADD